MKAKRVRLSPGTWTSVAAHACFLVLLVFGVRSLVRPAEHLRLPGTASGERMLLSYSTGGQPQPGEPMSTPPTPPQRVRPKMTPKTTPSRSAPSPLPSLAQHVEPGPGASGPAASAMVTSGSPCPSSIPGPNRISLLCRAAPPATSSSMWSSIPAAR